MRIQIALTLSLTLGVSIIYAHKPLEDRPEANDYKGAVQIEDPRVSYVLYHEVTGDAPRVWLKLEAEADFSLYVSLGVPVIERLREYRPALAVIGPGLPEAELSFDIPAGMGAVVFITDSINEPRFFHEPFTGTDSWIYWEEYVTLPVAGTYYVVGYHPLDTPGKLWVAPGREEKWELSDILKMPGIIRSVREFHEIN
jgi:hypothetical protein